MTNPLAPVNLLNANPEQKKALLAFITPDIAKSIQRRIRVHQRDDTYAWIDFPHLIQGNEGFFFDANGIAFKYFEIYQDPIVRAYIDDLAAQASPPAEEPAPATADEVKVLETATAVTEQLTGAESDVETNELTEHSDMLTGITFDDGPSEVFEAKKPIGLAEFSIMVQFGDLQEHLSFNVRGQPLTVANNVHQGSDEERVLNYSTDLLYVSKDTINSNGEPSKICALMGDLGALLDIAIYGKANTVNDDVNLDAAEPKVAKVTDGRGNDVTDTIEGQKVVELFRFTFVTTATLEEIDEEAAAPEENLEPLPVLCIPSWQRFIPRHEWTPVLQDYRKVYLDSTWLQIIPYVTVQLEQGPVFAFSRGHQNGIPLRALGGQSRIEELPPAIEGKTPGEALDEWLIANALRVAKETYGYEATYADVKQALAESFPIYAPLEVVDATKLGISLTLNVPDASGLTCLQERTLIGPMWMAREYANLHLHVATMVKPEHLSWKFETWAEVYLKTTMTPEVKQVYINNLKHIQFLFYRQRLILDKLQAALPPESSNWRFRQRIEHGTTMEASMYGDEGPWFTFSPPLAGLVDKFHLTWNEPEEGKPESVAQFRFGSSIEGKAYSSSDLKTWTEIPLSEASIEPVAEPGDEPAAVVVENTPPAEPGQVTPVYGAAPKSDQ